jgi:L-amino acid N-acyltransferase YncA
MTEIKSISDNLVFVKPKPSEHAPVTLKWFESSDGHETLLLMGNAEHEIEAPSLQSEIEILQEFITLEEKKEQVTWMLQYDGSIVGVAWIELVENHSVKAPSVHLMIGEKELRGKGIGKATMSSLISYIINNISTDFIYSRHLKSNTVIAKMNQGLGFIHDGSPYIDENGLEWQNVILMISLP